MKILYYCNSAYQLINVLRIHKNKQENGDSGDVIIQNSFPNAINIANKLKEEKIFGKIFIYEKDKNKKRDWNLRIKELINPKKVLVEKYHLNKLGTNYDYIIIPKINQLIGMLWRVNKRAKIEYYEEGGGNYFDLGVTRKFRSKPYNFIFIILNRFRSFSRYNTLYLSAPELFDNNDFEVKK